MSFNSRAAFIVGGIEVSPAKLRPTEDTETAIAGVKKNSPVE
jgi:hypothetical protein